MQLTLKDWYNFKRPVNDYIVNASILDGSDKSEFYNFPIGLTYRYLNLTEQQKNDIQHKSHKNMVLCCLNSHTDSRRRGHLKTNRSQILKTLQKNNIKNIKLEPDVFHDKIGEYKFVISPEGNGIDCHRHYEAIVCGSIPIIEYNEHMERKYNGLPVLFTYDYSEINEPYLERMYSEMINKKYDFTNVFFSSYNDKDKEQIKINGNYWCKKRIDKIYYI